MEIKILIILIITGIFSGMISGLIGVGGGIVIIPSLILLLKYDQITAQGTSIAILLFPIGIMAFFNYYKNGNVNMTHAIIIAIVFMLSAFLGSKIAVSIDPNILRKIFAFFLLLVSIKMFFLK